ncbi:MAG: HXXEE domain-containing protein [Bacteroidota bacterium]
MTLKFSARTVFTALIVAFVFHNIEEAISICRYPVHTPVSFIQPANCRQFVVAVMIITLVVLISFVVALRTKQEAVYILISTAISAGLVLNVLIPHLIVALYTFNYTPGLLSAVILNFPLGLITLSKNRSVCKSRQQFYKYVFIGLVAGYLIFAVVMLLTSLLVDR